jgi:hypothetical protein
LEPPIRERSSRLNSTFRSERLFWTSACRRRFDLKVEFNRELLSRMGGSKA